MSDFIKISPILNEGYKKSLKYIEYGNPQNSSLSQKKLSYMIVVCLYYENMEFCRKC